MTTPLPTLRKAMDELYKVQPSSHDSVDQLISICKSTYQTAGMRGFERILWEINSLIGNRRIHPLAAENIIIATSNAMLEVLVHARKQQEEEPIKSTSSSDES